MRALKRLLSPVLCCFGMRASEDHTTSDLQTLPSALSVPLSASQIPHAVSQPGSNTADTEALRELFRSSSSVRGYRTASLPSGSNLRREPSLDTDFKFGSQGQQRKQPSRLEQLGSHIKQKLSESRLSKSSSRPRIAYEDAPGDSARHDNAQLGMSALEATLSQRSTGLLELLMSRTASEGGYDSDAKSIQTAMLKASDGTKNRSPRRLLSLSSPADVRHIATDGAPPSPVSIQAHEVPQPEADHAKPLSDPLKLFTKVALAEKDESPIEVLNCLSGRVADGNIELAGASESKANPALAACDSKEHDPFTSSPSKDYALSGRDNTEFTDLLKKLGDSVAVAKRQSLMSNVTGPRASLVSDLDPNLLDFISKYGERPSVDIAARASDDNAAASVAESNSIAMAGPESANAVMPGREAISKKDLSSLAGSDRSSLHLYNMRISQRLASPSFVAASSRPNTSHTTIRVLRENSPDRRLSISQTSVAGKNGRLTTTEHNRRPSDPETRRLFEGDIAIQQASSRRRPGTSPDHVPAFGKPKPFTSTEDASSFYWSDGELDDVEPSRQSTRKRNPNSIAIGGRSESISLPIGSSSASIGNLSVAEESAWFSRKPSQQKQVIEQDSRLHRSAKRNRSISMPDRNNVGSCAYLVLPSRHLQHSTEADETLSEISADQLQAARKEKLTETSAQAICDKHNERMSEIESPDHGYAIAARPGSCSHRSVVTPDTRQSLPFSRISAVGRCSKSGDDDAARSIYNGSSKFQESATDIWHRSFKQALEEPENDSLGGFLTSPRFDRDGRRRSTRSSVSAVQMSHQGHRNSDVDFDLDPLQETQALNESSGLEDKPHIQVCMKKPDPLPTVNPRRSITTIDTGKETPNALAAKKTSRKKSILDIGRRFTVIGASSESEPASGASTPPKDLFSLWGRFPSHTREERCGSAGPKDGVAVRDFALNYQDENTPSSTLRMLWARPTTARGLHTPGSWRMLQFGKKDNGGNAQSKNIRATLSLGARYKKSRKGLSGRWRRLYRSSSTEFRAYAHTHGHRSSISVGASVEYPELEVIPGSEWQADVNGSAEIGHLHEHQAVNHLQDRPVEPLDTQPWTRMYRDCVGSLSNLKSDPELGGGDLTTGPDRLNDRHFTNDSLQNEELRDSTVDFEYRLGKEHEAVQKGLIHQIEGIGQSEEQLDVNARA
ncbi:uncharacterized protein Z519_08034 [Cladophialophora bantiana CBS 173.52]|uniref:Uncharacterized protein n=1 Tax=Cladophialophora bantiana (strain ATCC 10958 / CBS 173.52 / CDC B-1940 / NIH 8579) TaxID=1442370 RepID=A0A0D2HK65_CLAB1|nr:uncharacterized protein Z519_08034 [Cladophialophora bantiana CBS 173.52]KIW91140.1 hypothetical protein Z519_08034 [Cladophialophora bantiana CBS 173.52]